jgi:hypothetical protein
MTGSGPLGRDSMPFADKMQRFKATIDNAVYAARIACHGAGGPCRDPPACRDCVFATDSRCNLGGIEDFLGDHMEQHDTMPETSPVPPCQCAGDCGCGRHGE